MKERVKERTAARGEGKDGCAELRARHLHALGKVPLLETSASVACMSGMSATHLCTRSLTTPLNTFTAVSRFVVPFSFVVPGSPSVKRGAQVRPGGEPLVGQCRVCAVPRVVVPMASMGHMGRRRRMRRREERPREMGGRATAQLPTPSATKDRGQPPSGRDVAPTALLTLPDGATRVVPPSSTPPLASAPVP